MSKKKKKDKKEKKLKALAQPFNTETTEKIKSLGRYLSDVSSYSDVGMAFRALDMLKSEVEPVLQSKGIAGLQSIDKNTFNMFGVNDPFGYKPQGSTFYSMFPNPFGIYAYLADNYAPIRICRNEYKKEIISDGFYLVGDKAKFDSTMETLKNYEIEKLIVRMCDHLNVYGNFWIWPIKNLLGGIKEFRLLEPQFLRPIMANNRREIIGWEYEIGMGFIRFGMDDLIQGIQDPSMACAQLGSPRLGALLVDIEADIQASMFNNTVFQKGGLIGIAIMMDPPNKGSVPGAGGANNYAALMEAKLNANKAGARSGYGYGVFEGPNIKVEKLHDLKTMDGAFRSTNERVKKDVALLMGVPVARVGVMLNTSGVYSPVGLEDAAQLQWDKSVSEVVADAHKTANEKLLPLLKITDVYIKQHKRYNALTRTATQSILDLSQVDSLMSIDEARVQILKRPPLGGKEGAMPLRRIPNVSATSETVPTVRPVPIPAEEQNDYE